MRKERPLFAADRHAVSPLGERCSGAGRYARLCTEAQRFDPGGAMATQWRRSGGAVAARPHRVPGGRGVFRNETIEGVEVELLAARSDLILLSTPTSAAPRGASSRRRSRREARRAPARYEVELVELRKGRSAGCFRPAPHRDRHGASERSSLHGSSLPQRLLLVQQVRHRSTRQRRGVEPRLVHAASKRAEQHATRRSSRSVSRNIGR